MISKLFWKNTIGCFNMQTWLIRKTLTAPGLSTQWSTGHKLCYNATVEFGHHCCFLGQFIIILKLRISSMKLWGTGVRSDAFANIFRNQISWYTVPYMMCDGSVHTRKLCATKEWRELKTGLKSMSRRKMVQVGQDDLLLDIQEMTLQDSGLWMEQTQGESFSQNGNNEQKQIIGNYGA